MRIGHGFDVHKFGDGDHLVVGGVSIPFNRGLIAHSDGDVALHALSDALLGACALGDIGLHFPDTDPAYADADSRLLLKDVYSKVLAENFKLCNADITILAQAPKMAPHISAMRASIADCLDADISQVNVKATTTEQLGFVGEKLGIAAHAVVLLAPCGQSSLNP